MKLPIAFVVLTVSTVTAYCLPVRRGSPTQLFYVDESTSIGTGTGTDPWEANAGRAAKPVARTTGTWTRTCSADNGSDKLWMEPLAFSLGLNENLLEDAYKGWAARHGKAMTAFRFLQWKRNFLMQEVWNRANGEEFDLNENGDLTKLEFEEAAQVQPCGNHEGVQDFAHRVYWEEGLADNTYANEKAKAKTQRFKQVGTFSGGFRLVEVVEAHHDGTPSHRTEAKSNPVDRSSTGSTAASSPSRFRQKEQPKPKRGGFVRAGLLSDPAIR